MLAGLAVSLPPADVGRIERLPGVQTVYPSVRYHALPNAVELGLGSESGPELIGAPAIWGPELARAGRGIKIGIIDDGIDPSHPYFDPSGFDLPPGFPKGNAAFTTAKVIVARAFPPPDAGWRFAGRPFDGQLSSHGLHVAGIAAGNAGTVAPKEGDRRRQVVSGVAPLAYLGNYKALTVPTASGLGLNGNSPEIVAAIEAAVADGMDVINLSLGEPEISPDRDAVAIALDNAAAAGVIPVVAAGNDFFELGIGSVSSPGTARRAITVGAIESKSELASFSASGPTATGLQPKPDVVAPGVDILSASPDHGFSELSGTSMASPHVAGGAALLRELHPEWTVEQVKSALALTADDIDSASTARQGAGLVDLPAAADPGISAAPTSIGFGLVDVRDGLKAPTATVSLSDLGGGGTWTVRVETQWAGEGASVQAPSSVSVPGELTITATAAAAAVEGERTGFVVLERGGAERRLPFWFRVTRPRLPEEASRRLTGAGTFASDAARGQALVASYRYPDARPVIAGRLRGPEVPYRLDLDRGVANLGVAVVSSAPGVRVEPRIVRDADENRLTGATSLPYVANPYLARFLEPIPSAAALLPDLGSYTIVFDTPGAREAGRFRFRVWIDDVTPPSARLVSSVAANGRLLVRVADGGSGVDPEGISYRIDGRISRTGKLDGSVAVLELPRLRLGRHRLVLTVSDRQEAKNNENVPRILPNTRVLETAFTVPRS